ncbi:pectinesterase family protein [Flavobacterium faecale]|uniref:pectinesterase family protein n=1 Tax=Flavobacterium faecale TaxID=1355330 RepID=UPI003AB09333
MFRKLLYLCTAVLMCNTVAFGQKTDVWDFGATQLDPNLYNNKLTVDDINTWYTYSGTIVLGTSSGTNTLTNSTVQTLTSGVLTLKTGNNDRLYTTNTAITRYGNSLGTTDSNYSARYYCNGNASSTTRFFTLTLNQDDEVTVVSSIESGFSNNNLTVVNTTTNTQTELIPLATSGTAVTLAKFQAKAAGDFKISCLGGKGNYYRIYRKPATYVNVTGAVDQTLASGIPSIYSVSFTNEAGKVWTVPVNSGSYNVNLPAGYTYELKLIGADGYIISNGNSLQVLETTTNHNFTVLKVDLFTVSGAITGLGTNISKLSLTYTPNPSANKIFIPKPLINTSNSTYTVELESNVEYTISAQGVNDYTIPSNKITITGTTSADVVFNSKPVYPITVNTTGLNVTQQGKLSLIFTNLNENGYGYNFNYGSPISLRDGTYVVSYTGLSGEPVELKLISNLQVNGVATSKTLNFKPVADTSPIAYVPVITVGTDKDYSTINNALFAVSRMTRTSTDRVTIMIDPGNYEEMIVIKNANITLKNASSNPSIALQNKGVDINSNAVRITSYYGVGYNYFSQGTDNKWNAEVLAVNKENGYTTYENVSGTTNGSYWNATAVIAANGFEAHDIIFENSFNQYISKKESEDVIVLWESGNKGVRPTTIGDVSVQNRSFVERAAAIGVPNNIDKVILYNCRVVGRQDSFFGGSGARVVVYKGAVMGAVDYIFGGMTAVFYKTDFVMNVSDVSSDAAYLTAPQQSSGRGFLLYECKVTSAIPGIETASVYRAKPGFFGRPWAATTSEVVVYKTTIETSNFPGSEGLSLISPPGWTNSLGGTSDKIYEYGTIENSGVNNAVNRVTWSKVLTSPTLTDGTAITTFNFTKGNDNWDPIPQLISLGVKSYKKETAVNLYALGSNLYISNVKSITDVNVYDFTGALVKSVRTNGDTNLAFPSGLWIATIKAVDGQKVVKFMIN